MVGTATVITTVNGNAYLFGRNWTDTTPGAETWADISPVTDTWTTKTQSTNTWLNT
jgi:hypothetical protein